MNFKTLLIAVMSLVAMATMAQEKTSYAVWCGGNKTLYFLTSEKTLTDNGTFTLGSEVLTITNQWSGTDVTATGSSVPKWNGVVNGSIERVVFDESFKDVKPTNCNRWFYNCYKLKEIKGIDNLNTESVTDMSYMFFGCSALSSLDLSNFNTASVQSMFGMFCKCSALTSLDLSKFDTKNVKSMRGMFDSCSSLTELNLSNFNTASVQSMGGMFDSCSSLSSLDLSSFNTGKVTDMYSMFYNCSALTSLDLSSFNTESVTNMNYMFSGCSSLISLDLSKFDTKNVAGMGSMFTECSALTSLDIRNFKPSAFTEMGDMFSDCDALKTIDLRNADKAADMLATNTGFAKRGMLVYIPDAVDVSNEIFEENYAVKPVAATTSFARTFTAGNMSTICLPFAVAASTVGSQGTLYKYANIDTENNAVKFTEVTGSTEPHTAYLFKPATSDKVIFTGAAMTALPADIEEGAAAGLYGTYAGKTFTADDAAANIYYGWANGSFWRAGEGASVMHNRAYLKVPAGTAPARLNVKLDNETTGISEVDATAADNNAPAYDLMGRRVSAGYKGIVIKNGKKLFK